MLGRLSLTSACLLTGLSAGFFYTYEVSVTAALALVQNTTYVETFQSINATIRTPWFGTVFFGSIMATVLAIVTNRKNNAAVLPFLVSGLLLNLLCLGITFMGNVPLNNALATYLELTPESATIARVEFESRWNQLNQWRTLAVMLGFLAMITGVVTTQYRQAVSD